MEFNIGRFINTLRRSGESSALVTPEAIMTEGKEIDINLLRIERARRILDGSFLSLEQRRAIEDLVMGERQIAHNQTCLAWELTLLSFLDTREVDLGELRGKQEEQYRITSELLITSSNLDFLEGKGEV